MKDIYQAVTDRIIAELETGTAPWVKPWSGEADPFPRNASSQRYYKGINVLTLGIESAVRGYASNQWLTFRQALQHGGHVRKGETSTPVVYFEPRVIEADDGDPVNTKVVPMLKVFAVFNLDQTEGLAALKQPAVVHAGFDPVVEADSLIERSGADVRHQGFRAFYSPASDLVYLPQKHNFADAGGYYATALHELTHWTGHGTRLDRQFGKRFGDSQYAMEELVAEIGAAFLSSHCRIDGQLQHANYINSWLSVLHRDKKAIFTAAAKAQQAADFLLAKAGLSTTAQAA